MGTVEKLNYSGYLIVLMMVDYYILNLAGNAWSWMLLPENVVELKTQLSVENVHSLDQLSLG